LLYMLPLSLFRSMRDANPTPDLRRCGLSGHFENNCRLLAPNPHGDAEEPSRMYLLMGGRAEREMPHKWWIFRRVIGFGGCFLP